MSLPAPLTPAGCDCTDLDGFMLNVERLMASELVALSSHEVVAAALFLWCRAWKQRPAASLPNDERVLAAFARLPLARFRKVRAEALRGFIECSDGRLYHRVLAEEACRAFERKAAFRKKRETDAERLRRWRASLSETPDETRFVAEGQGQGQGQGQEEYQIPTPSAPVSAAPPPDPIAPNDRPIDLKAEMWRRGKAFLAKNGVPEARAVPMLGKWRRDHGDVAVIDAMARAESECASEVIPFIEACFRGRTRNGHIDGRSEREHERQRLRTEQADAFRSASRGELGGILGT